MRHYLPLAVLALLPAFAVAADPDPHRWNLADLYPSVADWSADASRLDAQLEEFKACNGKLGQSARRFKACLDLNADIYKRYYRLYSYASQTSDEDTGSTAGLDLKQRADVIANRVEEASAFVRPEVLRLGRARVSRLLAQDKSLAIYRHPLDQILRAAPHTLDSKGEALVASFGMATGAAQSVYTTLANADMPWPKLRLSDGSEITVDQSAYTRYRALGNRADRKLVFDAFWGKWKQFERSYGVLFYESLKKDALYARVRNYPDSLTAALDANKIPVAVYNTLIEQANANLPTLHRYFKLRASMLGVPDMRYYDIYPPLVLSDLKYPIATGIDMMLESAKVLGPEYLEGMKLGLAQRWMDVYPRPRKRSGAYMNGSAYDVHPYLLLNYNDDYESASTLAHEWGHAMHSWLANKSQPFVTADYPVFTAEIASTTNEVFLLAHALKAARSDDERLLYLGSALENLRGTFFRQAMFADFEREVHARVDRGESLTGAALTKLYGDILRRYHGEREGVVRIDDLYTVEWAFIPHFYNRFYVFQYATSIAAGSMFAQEVLARGEPARERYLDILRAGGGRYPYELVKAAGVDLATPAPYQAVVARMNRIMDEIEQIQARRKPG